MAMNSGNKKALKATVKQELKSRAADTKAARSNMKNAMKDVKKAGANTPKFKAIMKGKYDGR